MDDTELRNTLPPDYKGIAVTNPHKVAHFVF
jgi:hypothetical protein